MPVKRLGWRKYARRWVTDPKKLAKGEKLSRQWESEQDLGWKNPTRWARVIWKSKKRTISAEIKVKLTGAFTDAQANASTWDKLEHYAGPLPKEMTDAVSPGLYVVSINKQPTRAKVKYHYQPEDGRTTPKFFFGSSLEARRTTLEQANWRE